MKCSNCHASVDDNAKFCPECGSPCSSSQAGNTQGATPVTSPLSFSRTADKEGHSGTRGQKEQGSVRFFYGKARHAHSTVQVVDRYLLSQNLETQILEQNDEVIVQGKPKSNIFKKVLGLDCAITVGLAVVDNDMKVKIGGARWMDKAAVAAVSWFILWPLALTAGLGIYKQKQLLANVEKEITAYLASKEG